MSRTDKDRPYWVMLNDEGVVKHDHTFCTYWGNSYTTLKGKIIRDDEGNPVMETHERWETANWIAENAPRTKDWYRAVNWPLAMLESMRYTMKDGEAYWLTTGKGINPIWQEAQNLVNIGQGDRKLLYSSTQREKREEIIIEVPQECTEHIPEGPRYNTRYNHNGCYRTLPRESERRNCSCDRCEPGGIWAEKRSRTMKKNILRNMTKAANADEGEWEDDFEERELYLAKPLRYTSQWC